jgi:hypothetical protein
MCVLFSSPASQHFNKARSILVTDSNWSLSSAVVLMKVATVETSLHSTGVHVVSECILCEYVFHNDRDVLLMQKQIISGTITVAARSKT